MPRCYCIRTQTNLLGAVQDCCQGAPTTLIRKTGFLCKRWRLTSSNHHCSINCPESLRVPIRISSISTEFRKLFACGRHKASCIWPSRSILFMRLRRLGYAPPPYAAAPHTHRARDDFGTSTAVYRGAAAFGSWQPILHVRLSGPAAVTSHCAQPSTCWEMFGQPHDG